MITSNAAFTEAGGFALNPSGGLVASRLGWLRSPYCGVIGGLAAAVCECVAIPFLLQTLNTHGLLHVRGTFTSYLPQYKCGQKREDGFSLWMDGLFVAEFAQRFMILLIFCLPVCVFFCHGVYH